MATYKPSIRNVVEDTTPQLGGNLDTNEFNIAIKGDNGNLTISSDTDGGEYNIEASASGTLAIYGAGGNTLDVNLLDGKLTVANTIELGHASDTTIARVSAGKIAVEGKEIIDASSAQTATNKVITNVATTAPATPADGMLWWDTDDTNTTTGMLNSKVIALTRDTSAANADVAYTGVGFIPSSIHFLMVVDGTLYRSDGVVDSSRVGVCNYQSAANTYYQNLGAAITYSNQSGWAHNAVVKSYDVDGFTLTWGKIGTPTAGTMKVTAICYK